ncbi:RNA polymerase sigma factor [Corynebacterium sp. Marseille-P4321]|uniref:RNA polymerase sigma factor n=1 Tax=Corynebacterium sp. Marseille-P4321 TaxID=2736603 RepID=UPI000893148A|nr:sigma-70 family RNA polymerase sigma factor [Corynebacterium sp. Marseille-P4321]OEX92154.1 RNA polymerase subunit sigma [Corynebacterium sp. BCW_4722]
MQHRTDRQLVADYLAGDGRAFTQIVKRHWQRLYFVARNYARDEHDAQDIVQDAFFKAARNMHTYRGDAKLSTWLHRMCINAAIDHQRRVVRACPPVSLDDDETVTADANKYLSYNPLENAERVIAMRQALAVLPTAQRKALWLIDVAGMTVEHAADELGVKPGTVKSRRYRAREAVAAAIGERAAVDSRP